MRFSIQAILFLILVTAILLTGTLGNITSLRRVERLIKEHKGELWYDHDEIISGNWDIEPRKPENEVAEESDWLVTFFGEGYSQVVRAIKLENIGSRKAVAKSLLSQHRGLYGVECLILRGKKDEPIPATHLYPIYGLNHLRFLQLGNARLDRSFFESLSKIENLELVFLSNCEFELADLEPLHANPHLAWVSLGRDDFLQEAFDDIREKLPEVYVTPNLPEVSDDPAF